MQSYNKNSYPNVAHFLLTGKLPENFLFPEQFEKFMKYVFPSMFILQGDIIHKALFNAQQYSERFAFGIDFQQNVMFIRYSTHELRSIYDEPEQVIIPELPTHCEMLFFSDPEIYDIEKVLRGDMQVNIIQ